MTPITDAVERVLEGLPSQFDDAVNLRKFITIFALELQELEDAVYDCVADRMLETAEGTQLDQYGKVLGQARGTLGDELYRRLLKVRIVANRSHGTVEAILECATVLLDAIVRYFLIGAAQYRLEWEVDAHTATDWLEVVLSLVGSCTPAAVEFSAVEGLTGAFRFDHGPGFNTGTLAKRVY